MAQRSSLFILGATTSQKLSSTKKKKTIFFSYFSVFYLSHFAAVCCYLHIFRCALLYDLTLSSSHHFARFSPPPPPQRRQIYVPEMCATNLYANVLGYGMMLDEFISWKSFMPKLTQFSRLIETHVCVYRVTRHRCRIVYGFSFLSLSLSTHRSHLRIERFDVSLFAYKLYPFRWRKWSSETKADKRCALQKVKAVEREIRVQVSNNNKNGCKKFYRLSTGYNVQVYWCHNRMNLRPKWNWRVRDECRINGCVTREWEKMINFNKYKRLMIKRTR